MTPRIPTAIVLACLLSACASTMDGAVDTIRYAVKGAPGPDAARLDPRFRYLRVTVGDRTAFLALGNVERRSAWPIEVWYSAQREVLRLQNGRVVGAVGLVTEWRSVLLPELPAWSELARSGEPHRWERTRDVMPGYHYGVRDALEVRPIPPPEHSALVGRDVQGLVWFEERSSVEPPAGMMASALVLPADVEALPPARYAVELRDGQETVVYGEQCLAAGLCFTWQRWNIAK